MDINFELIYSQPIFIEGESHIEIEFGKHREYGVLDCI